MEKKIIDNFEWIQSVVILGAYITGKIHLVMEGEQLSNCNIHQQLERSLVDPICCSLISVYPIRLRIFRVPDPTHVVETYLEISRKICSKNFYFTRQFYSPESKGLKLEITF